jgi:uncharacterized protein
MTPQEKDLLTTLLDRLKNAPRQAKDPEADTLIRQAMAGQPDLPYYLVQTVLIQDLSLHQAQQRISDLENQLTEAQQAAKPSATSFLGGLFGHQPSAPSNAPPPAGPWTRSPQVAAAPPAQPYAQPGYQPQQQGYGQPAGGGLLGGGAGGGGFLRSAAATAAGVAGGALLFQGISSLFGNHYAGGLMGAGMTPGLGETVVNNYYGNEGAGGDWSSDPGGASGSGGWSSDAGVAGGGGDYASDNPGSQDFSSDQDWGSGGDWSSDNTSC